MEKTMSTEDKIRKAEEIYNRRRMNSIRTGTTKVNIREKKDVKLFKKMTIQILICLSIYSIFYVIKNNNYIFSEDFINKTNEVLSYDTNFQDIYLKIIQMIQAKPEEANEQNNITESTDQTMEENIDQNTEVKETEETGIGGAEENKEETNKPNTELSQMEQDAINIKNTIRFINPIQGTVTSRFGWRNPTTNSVPKYHTGLDIASKSGTIILSATDGDVILASSKGDYGNHLKIQINDITIIYAHCKTLYAKQGEHVMQGQEIAEVGSTGNSTGPHLHFEIRKENRLVDPELIISI